MPASTKKDIYMARNMADLNKLADQIPKADPKGYIRAADNLFKAAEDLVRMGDEEKAYVMYMRYFKIYSLVKQTAEFKKNPKYYSSMFGEKKCSKAIQEAERLNDNLKERYKELKARNVAKKLEKTRLDEEQEKKAEEEKKKEEEEEKNKKSNAAKETSPGFISAHELYNLMTKGGGRVLLMDVRCQADYDESHFTDKFCLCINVPDDIVPPGITSKYIEDGLPTESRRLWQQRTTMDHIILVDWEGNAQSLETGATIRSLKDALCKWERHATLQCDPCVLERGYKEWLFCYPTLTTNSRVSRSLTDVAPSPIASLDNIDYDLDLGFLDSPKPEITPVVNGNQPVVNGWMTAGRPGFPTVDRSTKPKSRTTTPVVLPSVEKTPVITESIVTPPVENSVSKQIPRPVVAVIKENPVVVPQKGHSQLPQVNRSLKPDITVADVHQAEKEKLTKEQELTQYKLETHKLVAERRARLDEDQRQLDHLDSLKRKELKETAEIMRMKRRIQQEMDDLERERKQRLQEEAKRQAEVEVLREDAALKQALLAESGQIDVSRRGSQDSVATSSSTRGSPASSVTQTPQDSPKRVEDSKKVNDNPDAELAKKAAALAEKERLEKELLKQEQELKDKHSRDQCQREQEARDREQREALERQERERKERERIEKEKERERQEKERLENEAREQAARLQERQEAKKRIDPGSCTTPGLPYGWQKLLDNTTGRYYYVDHNTRTTHFQAPEPQGSPSRAPQQKVYKTKLRDEPSTPPMSGGLKRSHSSPNVAKLVQEEQELQPKPSLPQVNRSNKPQPSQQMQPVRNEVSAAKVRNLNPTWGTVQRGLTGLRNMGNTCYMNSTVQCLSNTAVLATYFLSDNFMLDINRTNFLGSGGAVAEEFWVVLQALWSGQYRSITPRDFKSGIASHNPIFAGYDQQDSQELLLTLMDCLHEDLNRVQSRPRIPEQNNDKLTNVKAAELAWENHKKLNDSIIVKLFQGLFKSTVSCTRCKKKSVTFDAFMYLSLPIPSGARCSLRDCLRHFAREEKMTGESQWHCPVCKCKRDAIKTMEIWKLPPILIIHLKRFYYRGMWREKISAMVDFPYEGLDLNNEVAGPGRRDLYSLYAVSNHYGTIDGGHYTAYCKNPHVHKWYKFDDHEAYELSRSDVKSSAAYILFYTSLQQDLRFK